jgi:hypothetical protein
MAKAAIKVKAIDSDLIFMEIVLKFDSTTIYD